MIRDFNIYIGYDRREHIAAEVCKFSIERRMTSHTRVQYLTLDNALDFKRPRETTQSTDFTYTRFMIPYMESYGGYSLFVDCDFLFLDDVRELARFIDPKKAVSVVKHPCYYPNSEIKMDGVRQHQMVRKNWASMIMFNNGHKSNKALSPNYVNTVQPGRNLHQFMWLRNEEIGSISLDWNTLDGYYELDNPRAIHYTDGGPWFDNYKNTYYSKFWVNEHNEYTNSKREP